MFGERESNNRGMALMWDDHVQLESQITIESQILLPVCQHGISHLLHTQAETPTLSRCTAVNGWMLHSRKAHCQYEYYISNAFRNTWDEHWKFQSPYRVEPNFSYRQGLELGAFPRFHATNVMWNL